MADIAKELGLTESEIEKLKRRNKRFRSSSKKGKSTIKRRACSTRKV